MTHKPHIAVLYTGGTIGMQHSSHGLQPAQESVLQALSEHAAVADFDITVCDPLVDSSQVTPQHYGQWQHWLHTHIDAQKCDGVLILHGTDSMAYTANVLALAQGILDVPVILTGSQQPLGVTGSDASSNLQAAVQVLVQKAAPKAVSVVFDGKLWQGYGSRKVSTRDMNGFGNKFQAPVAYFEDGVWVSAIASEKILGIPMGGGAIGKVMWPKRKTVLKPDARIASHYCLPVSDQWALRALIDSRPDAIIIQSFGHGNGLFGPEDVLALQEYQAHGAMVVNVSQVFDGHVALQYEASQALQAAGVFFAGDWSIETAYAAVLVGLSCGLSNPQQAQEYLNTCALVQAALES